MRRPMRVRYQGGNTTITIPRDVVIKSQLNTGDFVQVDFDEELGAITIKPAPSRYTLQSEQRTYSRKTKYDSDVEQIEEYLKNNPGKDLSEYLGIREKKFQEKLIAKGIIKTEE